ncbi:hypothetical protein BS78_02G045300 [Paspalum vaginatum]|nr:hypothetical protein BS78_02G045300 [Paspalum vaginatum]
MGLPYLNSVSVGLPDNRQLPPSPPRTPTGGRAPRCLLRSPPGPPPSAPPFPARPPAARRLPPRAVAVAVLRSLPLPLARTRSPPALPPPHRLAIAAPPPSSEVDPQPRSTPPHASRRDVKLLVIQEACSWVWRFDPNFKKPKSVFIAKECKSIG